jgi:hypothetical protein
MSRAELTSVKEKDEREGKGVWAADLSEDALQKERYERKLYQRPKDRSTLQAFSDFLYDRGQYEAAIPLYEQSVKAGNEARRPRLRLARCRLAMHHIYSHASHHAPPLAPRFPPPDDLVRSTALASPSTAKPTARGQASRTRHGVGKAAALFSPSVSLLVQPVAAASSVRFEVARRHAEGARRDLAHVLEYTLSITKHPLTLFEVRSHCHPTPRALQGSVARMTTSP